MWGYGAEEKGKGKGNHADGPQGHKLPRTRLSAEKFQGVVTAWKGKYGFIKPDESVPHEKAQLRDGNLFVSKEDLEGTERLDVGAPVVFHISEDSTGLLAEEVGQTGPSTKAGREVGEQNSKGNSKGWGKSWNNGANGDQKGNGKGWVKPWTNTGNNWSNGGNWTTKGNSWSNGGKNSWSKGGNKGWSKDNWQSASKGKGKGLRGQGHMLSATRISTDKFMGTVKEWKGKYGWITPSETINHEKIEKHNGSLFVSMEKILGRSDLTEGATVDFHIYEDSAGLGAEEVSQY